MSADELLPVDGSKCANCDEPHGGNVHKCGPLGPEASAEPCRLNGKPLCGQCWEDDANSHYVRRPCFICKKVDITECLQPANPRPLRDAELPSAYAEWDPLAPPATLEQLRVWAKTERMIAFRVQRGCADCVRECFDCQHFWTEKHMNADGSQCLDCERKRQQPPAKRPKFE